MKKKLGIIHRAQIGRLCMQNQATKSNSYNQSYYFSSQMHTYHDCKWDLLQLHKEFCLISDLEDQEF